MGRIFSFFGRADLGPYIYLAVGGRNFPSGGKIFEILIASEPRMDTNSHESALIPDFGVQYRRRCESEVCARA